MTTCDVTGVSPRPNVRLSGSLASFLQSANHQTLHRTARTGAEPELLFCKHVRRSKQGAPVVDMSSGNGTRRYCFPSRPASWEA